MVAAALAFLGGSGAQAIVPERPILVFTKTAGFRHDSIPAAKEALAKISGKRRWKLVFTEDSAQFTAGNLKTFSAVVFLLTTGDVLNPAQQTAMEGFVRGGGGFVGVHSAADTEYEWAWYGRLVGAYFQSHPEVQGANVRVEDPSHPSMRGLPNPWTRVDEWYTFRANPRPLVHVLANVDESTYSGGGMGDHPIAWCQEFEGGRSWYTGMGHTSASYSDHWFMRHLAEGISWVCRR